MTAITKTETSALALMPEGQLLDILRNSLYPGAADNSIRLVLDYCKASQLDPMQKPVHIVPMWDKSIGGMRDVVMPGIGLYRTQAARSGEYAGATEPEFGPDITKDIGGAETTFPAWCRITIKRRLPSGEIAEFTAKEFWMENYAVKGGKEKSIAPNAMWAKRPYGQIAKCAEAQALRKAFPEIGSAPTADEMLGKSFDEDQTTIDATTGEIVGKKTEVKPPYSQADFDKNLPAWHAAIASGKLTADRIIAKVTTVATFTPEQEKAIRTPLVAHAAALRACTTHDKLDETMGAILEPTPELNALYDEMLAKLRG